MLERVKNIRLQLAFFIISRNLRKQIFIRLLFKYAITLWIIRLVCQKDILL